MTAVRVSTELLGSATNEPREVASAVIVADCISKSYPRQAQQISLRHEALKLLTRLLRDMAMPVQEPIWALRHVSFRVNAGESVALIGRNGSGKTTLLRVLCGITQPTEGQVAIRGRFATLIALGAGFNFERTGRENIFLNAAIQGVPPREVKKLIGEIITFSELGDFIELPVKRYSSGMITRLGFSIAAHIFPDIMFIDEVLAVGDAAFQQKCIDRILRLKTEGRTLMFVSHAPGLVRELCERAIWMHQGEVQADGPVDHVLEQYEAFLQLPRKDS